MLTGAEFFGLHAAVLMLVQLLLVAARLHAERRAPAWSCSSKSTASRVIREKFNFRAPWQAGTQAMINPK